MPLGIVAATAAEARILHRGAIVPRQLIRLAGGGLLIQSGIGPLRAQTAAQALMDWGATALMSWGSAGGLLPGLSPGTLILPEKIFGSDQSVYAVDSLWRERLSQCLKGHLDLHGEAIIESVKVLASSLEKAALWRKTGAVATDMESASIAGVAKERRAPFLAIRVITDPAEMPIASSLLHSVDEFGRVRLCWLGRGLMKKPLDIFGLVRLMLNFRAARASLAEAFLRGGDQLLCPSDPAGASSALGNAENLPEPERGKDL